MFICDKKQVQAPLAHAHYDFEIYYSDHYLWHGWFIGIEYGSWVRRFGFNSP